MGALCASLCLHSRFVRSWRRFAVVQDFVHQQSQIVSFFSRPRSIWPCTYVAPLFLGRLQNGAAPAFRMFRRSRFLLANQAEVSEMLRFHSARAVPAQCPHSARTVPAWQAWQKWQILAFKRRKDF